jgi:hypothetical protein
MENTTKSMYAVLLFLTVAIITLYGWFLHYLLRLEKTGCECALSWRRNYIMIFIVIAILHKFVNLMYPSVRNTASIQIIMAIMTLLFIIFTLQYIHHLKKVKCECSEDSARRALEIYAWVMVVMQVLVFFLGIFAALIVIPALSK